MFDNFPRLSHVLSRILMSEACKSSWMHLPAFVKNGNSVNLSKTKVVVFEDRRRDVPDFVLDGAVVDRVESYKYLGTPPKQ